MSNYRIIWSLMIALAWLGCVISRPMHDEPASMDSDEGHIMTVTERNSNDDDADMNDLTNIITTTDGKDESPVDPTKIAPLQTTQSPSNPKKFRLQSTTLIRRFSSDGDSSAIQFSYQDYVVSELEYKLVMRRLQDELLQLPNEDVEAKQQQQQQADKSDDLEESWLITYWVANNVTEDDKRSLIDDECPICLERFKLKACKSNCSNDDNAGPDENSDDESDCQSCDTNLSDIDDDDNEGEERIKTQQEDQTICLLCRHKFHKKCLGKWIIVCSNSAIKVCPVCKRQIKSSLDSLGSNETHNETTTTATTTH